MFRPRILHVAALFLLGLLASFRSRAADQPNIIFIVADDMGNADTGFQGCRDIPTPNLDALAKSGVRCTDGYVSHPFCSPTRAGLMTGRYQQRFGHENNPVFNTQDTVSGVPLTETMLPALLKKVGYVSGHVGKWHLGAAECFHPLNRGYDETFGFLGGGHQYFADGLTKPLVEYFAPLHRNRETVQETGYLTDIFGREAAAFVEKHAREPFFLYLAFNAPHVPLQASQKYLDRFPGVVDVKRKPYSAMTSALDDAVGGLMEKLQQLNLEEKTCIFFISDNGGPINEHSNGSSNGVLREGKGTVFEGGIRVPFLARWKGTLPEGTTYSQPVISLDLTATALALAHGAQAKPMDGVNLLPYLLGQQTGAPHEALFWRTGGGDQYAVRSGDVKLVIRGRKDAPLLYNLSRDISEQHDLAAEQPQTVAKLEELRKAWDAQLVPPIFQSPIRPNARGEKAKEAAAQNVKNAKDDES